LPSYLLAVDQGTTSTRAFLFDESLAAVGFAQLEFPQIYPQPGWVEHDPQGIWTTAVATARAAMASAEVAAKDVAAIGITNQRETTILWDRATGKPIHNAIVWQDRRTHDTCAALMRAGHERLVNERTGLLLDPYFSATKIAWILDHVDGVRAAAEAGKLAFGTVDTYLLWQLTGGKAHLTDATNAARTLLLDIRTGQWDPELLALFRIPASLMPEVRDSASDFGSTVPHLLGGPVRITYRWVMPDRRRRDLDNHSTGVVKVVQDCLARLGLIDADDTSCVVASATQIVVEKGRRALIVVIDPADQAGRIVSTKSRDQE